MTGMGCAIGMELGEPFVLTYQRFWLNIDRPDLYNDCCIPAAVMVMYFLSSPFTLEAS